MKNFDYLVLGSGIALAFTRSPLETACSAIDLDHISQGRAVLGLGSSAQSQIEGSFGMPYGKPFLARVDSGVLSIQRSGGPIVQVPSGQTVVYDGTAAVVAVNMGAVPVVLTAATTIVLRPAAASA